MEHQSPTHNWMHRLAGRFLVFEGPDGSGKSTQLARFVATAQEAGVPVCEVREPGGTGVGEAIRAVLLDHAHEDIALPAEMLLYMASRAQLVAQRIRPALQRGELVIADRFVASTIAYQGAAGGMPEPDIHAVARVATGGLSPDAVIIFDVDERTALKRTAGTAKRSKPGAQPTLFQDRMERKVADLWATVRQSYLDQAKADPDRFLVIDAGKDEDAVFDALLASLRARMEG